MKTKLIDLWANILMVIGTYLHKLGNKILDKSFLLHKNYKTKTGKKIETIQQIVTEYTKQVVEETNKHSKKLKSILKEDSYYIKRKPRCDN